MDRLHTPLSSGFVLFLIVIYFPMYAASTALTLSYCSSQNTGSSSDSKYWTWQSNGWCHDQCNTGYAYAIVQGNYCWCSNYTPQDQEDTSKCDQSCPGYPDEKCGSSDGKLFGYVKLDASPSGTQGLSGSSSSTQPSSAPPSQTSVSSAAQTHPATETVVQTVTASAVVVTQTPASSSAAPTTLQTSTSSSTSSSSTTAPQPSTELQILTVSGNPITKTVVYTPTAVPSETQHQSSKGSSTGAIVGGVVGGMGLIAAIVGAVFFVLWRRRRQQQEAGVDGTTQSGVQRNTSTMSKAGLLGPSEKISQFPPKITTNLSRNSRIMDTDSISPASGSDRRHSRPYIFDQRLNPSAIMNLDNTSRGSFVSMDDSHDYGRTLNVRNPDPNPQ